MLTALILWGQSSYQMQQLLQNMVILFNNQTGQAININATKD